MNTKPTIKNFLITILPSIFVVFVVFFLIMPRIRENREINNQPNVTNFEECIEAGNPAMESYPRQCRHGNQIFTEDIGKIVGGDRDERGCIGSAGYSWCEPKNRCLRIWEEACYANLEQEIQYLLAKKYERLVDEVRVTIAKQVGNYASGGVKFGADNQGAGGLFLAAKIDNVWQLTYDGNGSVDCFKLRQEYGFPDEVLKPNFCD